MYSCVSPRAALKSLLSPQHTSLPDSCTPQRQAACVSVATACVAVRDCVWPCVVAWLHDCVALCAHLQPASKGPRGGDLQERDAVVLGRPRDAVGRVAPAYHVAAHTDGAGITARGHGDLHKLPLRRVQSVLHNATHAREGVSEYQRQAKELLQKEDSPV